MTSLAFIAATSFVPRQVLRKSTALHGIPCFLQRVSPRQPTLCASLATPSSTTPAAASTTAPSQSAFARGETFSRRRIGMYELHREGVDPTTLLKRSLRFEVVSLALMLSFVSVFFIIPVLTSTPVPEAPIAISVISFLLLYALDVNVCNAAFSQALFAVRLNSTRVAVHEAAHFLVAHLLGFSVDAYSLPSPRTIFRAARDPAFATGVQVAQGIAQGDSRRVAALGLAGLAAELLKYGKSEGSEDDMALVSRAVRASFEGDVDDQQVTDIVRWGLMVSTRLIKQHSKAFNALVEQMQQGADVQQCLNVIDSLADYDQLVDEPFHSL